MDQIFAIFLIDSWGLSHSGRAEDVSPSSFLAHVKDDTSGLVVVSKRSRSIRVSNLPGMTAPRHFAAKRMHDSKSFKSFKKLRRILPSSHAQDSLLPVVWLIRSYLKRKTIHAHIITHIIFVAIKQCWKNTVHNRIMWARRRRTSNNYIKSESLHIVI